MMQKMWIDTDTASDDAVALILALKSKTTDVLGISIVAGNVPIELGVQAALYTIEMCGAKTPVHVVHTSHLYEVLRRRKMSMALTAWVTSA